MISLLIDTHDKDILLCLYKDDSVLDIIVKETNHNLTNYTMPLLDELLKRNNLNVHNLEEIDVVIGPGSFTGVRIGVTIAKMLAYTLNIKIKPITSLELYAVSSEMVDNKLVIIRDIKGVYGALYNNNELINDYFYYSNDDFDQFINEKNYFIVENHDIDLIKVHEYLKNIKEINAHAVNPLYVKMIEVYKHD